MSLEVHIVAVDIGGLTNATKLLFSAPSDAHGGGISVVEAAVLSGTTTSSLTLVKHSNAGTPALNGTIAAAVGGTAAAFVAGAPKAFTISTPFVDAGEWVGIAEGNVQAAASTATAIVKYVMGK